MNTYVKYAANVWLAACAEQHEKGAIIPVTNKYGKENDSIVFNLIASKNGLYYYSIIRADGMNAQEYAKKRAERLLNAAENAEKKSTMFWERSNKDSDFLRLGEPIKIGHHSEKKHRRIIEQAQNNMDKMVELSKVAETYEDRAQYWLEKQNDINLSMPESIDFYAFKLEEAQRKHKFYLENPDKREHSFSLTYAKKAVNEAEKNLQLAQKLWGE